MTKERIGVDRARVIIKNSDDRFLLLQEKNGPSKGTWTFPGGRIDPGEDIQATAVREAKEETGLAINIIRLVASFDSQEVGLPFQTHIFECVVAGGALNPPKHEILDARWFSKEEIEKGIVVFKGEYVQRTIALLP